jgi:toxin-antitoxin system PIN domain toxin
MVMTSLIDTNVLVALLHERHRDSTKAIDWLRRQDGRGSVLICRVVQMEALRLLTNPKVMKKEVLSPSAFWRGWDTVAGDDRFAMPAEPSGFEAAWRKITNTLPVEACGQTDAYLAALAMAGNWKLATFDRGLSRFTGLTVELLA